MYSKVDKHTGMNFKHGSSNIYSRKYFTDQNYHETGSCNIYSIVCHRSINDALTNNALVIFIALFFIGVLMMFFTNNALVIFIELFVIGDH